MNFPKVAEFKMSKKEYLNIVNQVVHILAEIFCDDVEKAKEWLAKENENFGGSSPVKLIHEGKARKVLLYCQRLKKENLSSRTGFIQ